MSEASATYEIQPVLNRQEWLAERKKAIGASDVAAILGVSPYASAWDVWATKTGKVEDWEGNEATRLGQRFEAAILDYAEDELGQLRRNVRIVHPSLPIASTLDAQCRGSQRPVEAKTSGLAGPLYGDWGLAGTNEVPENYLVQVHCQLLCTGADLGYLFALLPGRGIVRYEIERSDKLCDQLGSVLDAWWTRHVIGDVEPSRDKASMEIVKRMKRVPNKAIELDLSTELESLEACKQAIKDAEQQKELIEKSILTQLGDAECSILPDGRQVTYFSQTTKPYSVEAKTYRVLRIKKAPKK